MTLFALRAAGYSYQITYHSHIDKNNVHHPSKTTGSGLDVMAGVSEKAAGFQALF